MGELFYDLDPVFRSNCFSNKQRIAWLVGPTVGCKLQSGGLFVMFLASLARPCTEYLFFLVQVDC